MKTMIWKELRENFKWAALAFLALLLAEIYALSSEQKSFYYGSDFTLCGSAFLMTTAFGCAAVGAGLGVVQILPERHRDRWAALLHRPAPRSVIFFGKAIAGLALYFLATALPLLASVCYTAAPRTFPAPFVPGMALPALSDLSLGVVFYFAAFLACLDRGKWYGTKGMTVLAAAAIFLLHIGAAHSFVMLPLAAAIVLAVAAWGVLAGNGPAGSMPLAGRCCRGVVLLTGGMTALLLVGAVLVALKGQSGIYGSTGFAVSLDGKIFQLKERPDGSGSDLADLAGKPVTDERYAGAEGSENICKFLPTLFTIDWRAYAERYPRNVENYVTAFRFSPYEPEYWFLLVRGNYLIGYDRLSHRCVGIFDREGFKPAGARPVPFEAPASASLLIIDGARVLIAGSKLYAINIADRQMTVCFDAGNRAIYSACKFSADYNEPFLSAIATEDRIRFLDAARKPLFAIPYPHGLQRWESLRMTTDKARQLVYLQSESAGNEPLPVFLDEYDLKGNLLASYSVPGRAKVPKPDRWMDQAIKFGMPLGVAAFDELYSRLDPLRMLEENRDSEYTPGTWMGLGVVALALAAAVFLWGRRMGFSNRASLGWAAITLVFGLPGILTFRLATDWPVRLRCPSCGRKRAIEKERCEACGAAWSPPQEDGTEMIEGTTPAVGGG